MKTILRVNVEVSPDKVELLGEAAALLFNLKANPNGLYWLRAGQQVSKRGLGNTIIKMAQDTIQYSEQELEQFVTERRISI